MGQLVITLIKLAVFFPLVIGLILWIGKVAEKYNRVGNKSTMKVIERVPISKDNSLLVVKIEEKFYLLTSAQGKVEIVRELNSENYINLKQDEVKNLGEISMTIKNKLLKWRK